MANANFIANAVDKSLGLVDKSFSIRPKQLEAIINIVKGYDTLAILPTSYGKSLIFRLIPSVSKQLKGHTNNAVVAVIVPLESIIKDQISSANKLSSSLGIKACRIDSTDLSTILNENYNILIGTPEQWLDSDAKEIILCSHFKQNLKCLVIDEAHLVSWGESNNKYGEQPFREAFGRINELRSFACENLPILCLSATVDQNNFDLISVSCGVSKNGFRTVFSCSDRPNIKLSVYHCEEKSVFCLNWIIELLKSNGVDCPKMLIFCRTQILCGWLYEQFQYCNLEITDKFIGIYHANSWPHKKGLYLKSLTSLEGDKRVIICSSALGCRVDCQEVKFVVHFGPPHHLIDYAQQIGRAGRSNTPDCHAVLFNFPQYSKFSDDVKEYMNHDGCLRKKLFTPFSEGDSEIVPLLPAHICCNMCSENCNCGLEKCKQSFFTQIPDEKPTKIRKVIDKDCEAIQSKLLILHEKITHSDSTNFFVPSGVISGLTNEVVFKIVQHLKYIGSAQYLTTHLPVISESLAKRIFDIIINHFENIPVPEDKNETPCESKVDKGSNVKVEKYEFGDFEFDSDFSLEEEDDGSFD
ncbi:ATP-dependent DNA helicase RecQ-like [Clytia hemisphaerica]|uniref:ATP-dependent DNA helicase RecQ-like n=1 Tax=Clytia hemisphaerica TaxID=252671 RepID=UPI0034D3AA0F